MVLLVQGLDPAQRSPAELHCTRAQQHGADLHVIKQCSFSHFMGYQFTITESFKIELYKNCYF